MLFRKNDDRLRAFFQNDKRALLVTGARQVGKTFSIRQIGKECFEHVVEINFIKQKEALSLFENVSDSKDFLLRLSAFAGEKLVPGKTLIFFDEVQECKEIITAVKFLVDDASYRYVMSGSLLGVELQDVRSIPVGYMSVMDMYPLDLEEFALALGVGRDVLDYIHSCYTERKSVDALIHRRMLDLVQLYLMVGGMPQVVQTYLDTNNLRDVFNVQRDIIRLYRKDISKYEKERKLEIMEIFDLIPSELNAKNKRFILKDMHEKARFSRYENSFVWLSDAGVAIPTYNLEEPRLPLLINKQRNLFKLFSNDVGLLAAQYAGSIQQQLLRGEVQINYGSIFENLAAQELYAHGFAEDSKHLYYFNSKVQGELDFVVQQDGALLPIEVKSGKDYTRHKALDNVLRNQEYAISNAIVFCQDNVSQDGRVLHLPIYMLMCLLPVAPQNEVFRFDSTGLQHL